MTSEPSVQEASEAKAPIQQPVYSGEKGALFGIFISNFFLKIVTLGVYTFWARTKVRRYIWSHTKLLNESFAYLGTGKELMKGFFKFAFIYVLPVIVVSVVLSLSLEKKIGKGAAEDLGNLPLIWLGIVYPYAHFKGMRYRLSRTRWHGIRFGLRGDPWKYAKLKITNGILNVLTLGIYRPWGNVAILKFVGNQIHFGTMPFTYAGNVDELKKTWIKCWLLLLPTLGLSSVWYKAKYLAHVAKYARIGDMEFRFKASGGELLWLDISNILIILFTLGFGSFLATDRTIRFMVSHFKFRGSIDYESIAQAQKIAGDEGGDIYSGGDDLGL